MKKLSFVLIAVLLLCACLAGVCAAQVCVQPTPGTILQNNDSVYINGIRSFKVIAQWATFTPTPGATAAPTATPTRAPAKAASGSQPGIPNTGDNTNLTLWVGILGGSAAVIAAAAVRRKDVPAHLTKTESE